MIFRKGEQAIFIQSKDHPHIQDILVTVVSGLRQAEKNGRKYFGYEITAELLAANYPDAIWVVRPNQLKKLPPQNKVTDWTDCVWQPEGLSVFI